MDPSPSGFRPGVLHVAQPVDGGVARVVLDLSRAQLAAGLRVAVACPGGALATGLREVGAEVWDWPAGRSPGPGLPGEVRRLVRLLDEVRPDLVHAHSAKAGLAARLAVRGRVPTVFQPHAWSFEAVGGLTAALAVRWERWGAPWADRVVCVSAAERATGLRAGVRAAYRVIPNGIDTTRFSPASASPPVFPAPTAPPPLVGGHRRAGGEAGPAGLPLVVCVGRLCRQKGQDVLLRAWETVLQTLPQARLALVGDGPDREALRRRAHPSVQFTGAVADVLPWYRAADLVVLPSRWEGMALVPLEALGCARPVVLTDVDGARESLPQALATHCLVPPEDSVALARVITALLSDPPLRAALGAQGRRHIVSQHDVRHTAARMTAVYRELLTDAPPRTGRRPTHTEHRPAPTDPHTAYTDHRPAQPGRAPAESSGTTGLVPAERRESRDS